MVEKNAFFYDGQTILVVGLGLSGFSTVEFLRGLDVELNIKVIDTRENALGLDKLPQGIDVYTGGWKKEWLAQADLILLSPGIALATPEIEEAIDNGIPVIGDIELFAWFADAPVVAITGSNGKSTVTDLVGEMAKTAGINVGVGGNIGIPALSLLNKGYELYVLELSSFQLETTHTLELEAATFLNLSEDHMNRYQGMADYRQAKLKVFEHTKLAVVNRDDKETYPDKFLGELTSFGLDDKAYGLLEEDKHTYLCIDHKKVLDCSQMALVGRHNIMNALAAIALATQVNISLDACVSTLKRYTGLAHRCQLATQSQGVRWVNDSKATNVASTQAALTGLHIDGTLHLLVGGDGKGADFSLLAPILAELPVALYCYGRDGDAFMPLHDSAQRFDTMFDAMNIIANQVTSGDMVLLSPACASFDQFKSFEARGDAFIEYALTLTPA